MSETAADRSSRGCWMSRASLSKANWSSSVKKRKFHQSCGGLPRSPGYKKKRSRPSKLCILRRDMTESINFSWLASVDSIVVNLQGGQHKAKSNVFKPTAFPEALAIFPI